MEACFSYRPWQDKVTGKTYLKSDRSKCMTYYFYFKDEQLGLCYLCVPTWCPFRLQFYFNGHNWLANKQKERGSAYKMLENGFVQIADYAAANQRYLKFISAIATPQVGVEKLHKLAETKTENQPRHKGFNLFSEEGTCLFRTLLQGEFFISGFTNKQLRNEYLSDKSARQVTRLLTSSRCPSGNVCVCMV
jgi:hypothetical protein